VLAGRPLLEVLLFSIKREPGTSFRILDQQSITRGFNRIERESDPNVTKPFPVAGRGETSGAESGGI